MKPIAEDPDGDDRRRRGQHTPAAAAEDRPAAASWRPIDSASRAQPEKLVVMAMQEDRARGQPDPDRGGRPRPSAGRVLPDRVARPSIGAFTHCVAEQRRAAGVLGAGPGAPGTPTRRPSQRRA